MDDMRLLRALPVEVISNVRIDWLVYIYLSNHYLSISLSHP